VKLGLATSNGEAKRAIEGRAVEIKGEKVTDVRLSIDLKVGDEMIVRSGKKKFAKVVVR
jgi:tyrosyl-tRNA synthetase